TMRGYPRPNPVWILLFLLLPRDASADSKPQYLVLVPSQLYAGVPEKACVVLNHLNETVTLTITLEYESQGMNLLTDTQAKNAFYCSTFMIPEQSSSSSASITVQVDGPTQKFMKRKPMHVTKIESLVFVQTDKPIYKPGQKVQWRVVSLDISFRPLNETVSPTTNPKKNRIFQWHRLTLQGGLSQLSFPLSEEPTLGSYKIILQKESGRKIEHSFKVDEYVLPKFEVQVKMPKVIGFLEDEFEVSVCGLYTYGKPVRGLVTINICRKYSRYSSTCHGEYSQNICEEFSQQTDNEGCFTKLVKTKIFQLRQRGYDMTLQVEAKVKEEGTGLELTGQASSKITNSLSKLEFTQIDSHYRRGLPFFGQVKYLFHIIIIFHFTTDEQGLVNFSIDTSNFTTAITVLATYKQKQPCFDNWWLEEFHTPVQHTARHIFSLSKSYIHLEPVIGTVACGQTQKIRTHYILNGEILKNEKEPSIICILHSGIYLLSTEQGEMKGVFSFSFRVEPDFAPKALLLVYTVLPSGEVIADTRTLKIENCFVNKVNLSFSSAQILPTSDTNLKVTATAYSLCALRAVDQSVLLMKPEAELSPQSVYRLLPKKNFHSIRSRDPTEEDGEKCISAEDITHNGIVYTPKEVLDDDDAYMIKLRLTLGPACLLSIGFGSAGPRGPIGPVGSAMLRGDTGPAYTVAMREDGPAVVVKETVRKYFPETWIWKLVGSGSSDLAVKVPDTITEWKASAFCLSGRAGLGLSPTISLQVFQPFFLELTLPYSVVRGEAFTLKATVFNYLSHCIRVSVQLEASPAFQAIPVEKSENSHCVCGNRQKTVYWAVTPKSLGKVNFTATAEALKSQELCGNEIPQVPELGQKDTVVKPLIVEVRRSTFRVSEAFLQKQCYPIETGEPKYFSLKLPSDVVEGSARATYTVLGDILSSAMQNLQNLVQMPYGCGEQNMVRFVPNIYVLNYLKETQQLTEKIKSKAISYLVSGYQRQLNYKHSDGSYSTFGERGGGSQGNTWLTAFVLKSFSQARAYIFVEDSHIQDSRNWLSQKQKENGCFQRSGSLFNNAIKGGVDDEVTLSAYITIALLEMPLPVTHPVVHNALLCLEKAWESISEALLAYAFTLAGNQAKRKELLESLDKEAIKTEDSIHWQRPEKSQESEFGYQPRAPSVDVEMTSYLLLARVTAQPAPSSEDLSMASRMVKWITKQQNPNGGFSSTQDTVVALQALSKYGALTFTKWEKAATVTVKSSESFSKEFQVDETNRLLLQEVTLPEIPGEYSTVVSGSGCVYLQTSLRYNVLPKKGRKAPFTLKVDTDSKNCDAVDAHRKVQIHINISYTGERPSSNMVIVDVKMVSGFIPVKSSVKKVSPKSLLTSEVLSFSFSVEQDIQVENLKPATVKAYDYYETEEFAIEEYSVPCSAGKV
uniref:PZP alpha-2-macroglobulin like n=1 Tax=Sus scrofa TaxID=9823 RepID=A0A8D0PTE2_PIG